MNTTVRTTITLPIDVYENLRREAFEKKKPISHLIRAKVVAKRGKTAGLKKLKRGEGWLSMIGKYHVKNFREISREEIYDDIIKHKMSFGR